MGSCTEQAYSISIIEDARQLNNERIGTLLSVAVLITGLSVMMAVRNIADMSFEDVVALVAGVSLMALCMATAIMPGTESERLRAMIVTMVFGTVLCVSAML